MTEWDHRAEAKRLLDITRSVIKEADAKREADLSEPGITEMRRREIRDVRFDAHLAISDLLAVANLHARLAALDNRPSSLALRMPM